MFTLRIECMCAVRISMMRLSFKQNDVLIQTDHKRNENKRKINALGFVIKLVAFRSETYDLFSIIFFRKKIQLNSTRAHSFHLQINKQIVTQIKNWNGLSVYDSEREANLVRLKIHTKYWKSQLSMMNSERELMSLAELEY